MRVANIKTTERKIFHQYLIVTQPFHKIRKREMTILAELLYWRHQLSAVVSDDEILDKLVFSAETKDKISKSLNLKNVDLNQSFSYLRKIGVMKGKTLNKKYIPVLTDTGMKIVFNFILDEDKGDNKKEDSKENKEDSQ